MPLSKSTLLTTSIFVLLSALFTGCNPTDAQPKRQHQMRAQHLVVNTQVLEEKAPVKTKKHYQVILDNLNRSSATITLKNVGDKQLMISAVKLEDKSKLFKLDKSACGQTLNGGASCNMTISFLGEEEARLSSLITISSNDRRRHNTLVEVIANGQNKHSGILSASSRTTQKANPMLKLRFSLIDTKRFITITNDGKDTLTLGAIKIKGDNKTSFSFTSHCKKVLTVGESCEVEVNFDPQSDGENLAYLHLPSNGTISPSERIRLTGYSEPYTLEVTDFKVAQNVHSFLEDYFNENDTYYFRTMYQTQSDSKLESYVDNEINNYFAANGLKIAKSANSASRIVNIYPSITINSNDKNTKMDVSFAVNASLLEKSSTNGAEKASFNADINATQHDFHVIPGLGEFIQDEKFVFTLDLHATSYEDEYAVYKKMADIMSSKLFNVIGLKDTKSK